MLALALGGCASKPHPADVVAPPTEPLPTHLPMAAPDGLAQALGQPVHLEGRDLIIRADGAEVQIAYLSGRLVPAGNGEVVDLEVPASFEVVIEALELIVAEQTLQGMISGRDATQSPFSRLTVRTEGDSLLLSGNLRMLRLPFTFRANPRVTARGALALELEKVRVVGVGVKGFLGAFQGSIEKSANQGGHVLDIDEDRLVLNPFPLLGPPEIHAAFTSVEVHAHALVARLGELTPHEEGSGVSGLVITGGVLRTGRMVLFDSEIRLVSELGGPLVIDSGQMDAQLAAGYVKQAPDGSVTVYLAAPGQ